MRLNMTNCLLCQSTVSQEWSFKAKSTNSDVTFASCPSCGDYLYEDIIKKILTAEMRTQFFQKVKQCTSIKPEVIHLYIKPLVQRVSWKIYLVNVGRTSRSQAAKAVNQLRLELWHLSGECFACLCGKRDFVDVGHLEPLNRLFWLTHQKATRRWLLRCWRALIRREVY